MYTVKINIFALLNLRTAEFSHIKLFEPFLCDFFAQIGGDYPCAIMINFFTHNIFSHILSPLEICKNIYHAKMSTFTVSCMVVR